MAEAVAEADLDDDLEDEAEEEDDGEVPLDLDVDDEKLLSQRRRLSMSEDQGQSAKLALVEARVELDDLRKSLVQAQAENMAAARERKIDREESEREAQRHEEVVLELRREVEAVRELLEAEVHAAEDGMFSAMERARAREKVLQSELDQARVAVESNAASTLQRRFNKRWTRELKERWRTALATAEAAEAEQQRLRDELLESQRAATAAAARTIQRALMLKMHRAVRAAGGDTASVDAMREERRNADVRQLEQEQAELRTNLNESRRRAARLEKRVQQADAGANLVGTAIRQILALEVSSLESERDVLIADFEDRLAAQRRRMINLCLKLSSAQAKARVCNQKVASTECTPTTPPRRRDRRSAARR